MHPFRYERAQTAESATRTALSDPTTQFIAGGTSQVDLMKEDVHRPTRLIDVSRLPLTGITALPDGGLRIGANAKNSEAAYHPRVRESYIGLSEAILAGASTQIRNMASMAGNILQRTRCPYFRDTAQPCNKREPGTGCPAVQGYNRTLAILGQTDNGPRDPKTCIATQPSDMAVALAALEAVVVVQGANGQRRIAFNDFHRLVGDTPHIDTNLQQGELILALELPPFQGNSHYLKVRDRASYAYAIVSCAVALRMDGERIARGTLAIGGVAHKPWRPFEAEKLLSGQKPSEALFRQVAERAFEGAKTYEMNAFKPALGRATVLRALMEAAKLTPMQAEPGSALAASAGGVAGDMAMI